MNSYGKVLSLIMLVLYQTFLMFKLINLDSWIKYKNYMKHGHVNFINVVGLVIFVKIWVIVKGLSFKVAQIFGKILR